MSRACELIAVSKLVNRQCRLKNGGPQIYPAIEIVLHKRKMGAGFFDSEQALILDPASAIN